MQWGEFDEMNLRRLRYKKRKQTVAECQKDMTGTNTIMYQWRIASYGFSINYIRKKVCYWISFKSQYRLWYFILNINVLIKVQRVQSKKTHRHMHVCSTIPVRTSHWKMHSLAPYPNLNHPNYKLNLNAYTTLNLTVDWTLEPHLKPQKAALQFQRTQLANLEDGDKNVG